MKRNSRPYLKTLTMPLLAATWQVKVSSQSEDWFSDTLQAFILRERLSSFQLSKCLSHVSCSHLFKVPKLHKHRSSSLRTVRQQGLVERSPCAVHYHAGGDATWLSPLFRSQMLDLPNWPIIVQQSAFDVFLCQSRLYVFEQQCAKIKTFVRPCPSLLK